MGLCIFPFTFMSSLPCLCTFWHAIPTSLFILVFFFVVVVVFNYAYSGKILSLYSGRELSKHFLSRFGAKCFTRFTVAKAALVQEIHFGSPEDIKRSVRI